MSNDSEHKLFADGVSEDIITELSKLQTLFVFVRNFSFALKNEQLKVKDVGVKLGVLYVVEDSVRRAGNRIRITTQIINAIYDKRICAERYDRDLEKILVVQDEVTKAIFAAN